MKVKELMIGDWFHNNYTNENYQVWPTFLSQATNFGKRMDATFEDINISPIPLTSEMLERNGFERVPQPGCASPYHWMLEKYEEETDGLLFRIKAFNNPFGGMFVSIDNPSACETISFGKQIKFVHELQHALQLCEIELEIKLED